MEKAEYTAATPEVVAPVLSTSSVATPIKDSEAVKRLLDEVRFDVFESGSGATAYNRQHNRHNR